MRPEGGGGTGTSDGGTGGAPAGFCEDVCARLADHNCFPTATCTAYCGEHAADWPAEVQAAFAKCAAEDGLCWQSVEVCMLGELHPDGSAETVRVTGSGFDAYDGLTVRVWNEPATGIPYGGEAVITAGAFEFEWIEHVSTFESFGPLMLVYIDVDKDDTCEAASDLTASEYAPWNGDLLNPVFESVLTPPLRDADFVCDSPL